MYLKSFFLEAHDDLVLNISMHIHIYLDQTIMASYYHKDVLMKNKSPDRSRSSCLGIRTKVSPERLHTPRESASNGHVTQKCKLSSDSRTQQTSGSSKLTVSSPPVCKPSFSSRSKTELELKRSNARVLEPDDKRVGSLEDSPKWSRIKEAFEDPGSQLSLNKAFSRSTSSLPRPRIKQLTVATVKRTESCDRNSYCRSRKICPEETDTDLNITEGLSSKLNSKYSTNSKPNVLLTKEALGARQRYSNLASDLSSVNSRKDLNAKKSSVLKEDRDSQEPNSLYLDCVSSSITRRKDLNVKKSSVLKDDRVSQKPNSLYLDCDLDDDSQRRNYCSSIDELSRMTYGRHSLKLLRSENPRYKTSDYEGKSDLRKITTIVRDDILVSRENIPGKKSDVALPTTHKSLPDMESINSLKSYLREIQDSKLQRQKFLNSNSVTKERCSINFSLSSLDLQVKSTKPKFTESLNVKVVKTSTGEYEPFHTEKEHNLGLKKRTTNSHINNLEDSDLSKVKVKQKSSFSLDAMGTGIMTRSCSEESPVSKSDWGLKSSNETNLIFSPKLCDSSVLTRPQSSFCARNEKACGVAKLERELTFHGTLSTSKNNLPGWKMTSSGSWIKVTLENDLPASSIKSKVALLAHQFDHLSISDVENTRKDINSCKNKGHSDESNLSCQALDSICCPVFVSEKVKEENEPTRNCNIKETVITKETRKLGMVKQVVQNFEESSQKTGSSSDSETSPTLTRSEHTFFKKNSTNPVCSRDTVKDYKQHTKNVCENFRLNPVNSKPQRHLKSDSKLQAEDDGNKSYSTFAGKSRLPSNHKLSISPCLTTTRNSPSMMKRNTCHRPLVPPPRKPLKHSSPVSTKNVKLNQEGESSLLAELEMWLVQKYDQKDQQERQPNDSFLWKKGASLQNNENGESTRKSDLYEQSSPSYYSKPFIHSTNGEEHIYMEARVPSTRGNKFPVSSCDSDEGWVDMDDPEVEQAIQETRNRDPGLHSNLRSRNIKAHCVRRSWIQSIRDKSTNEQEWAHEDYKDISVWEPEEEENSSSSSSTNSDHLYEALYDEIIPDEHDVNILDSRQENQTSSSCAGGLNDSGISHEKLTDAYDLRTSGNSHEKKSDMGPNQKRALAKSDIHLELTSNLDRVKVRKDTQSVTNVSEPQSDTEVVTSKKRTLIKFMLRQKNNSAVKTHSHKKGATFYVRWSKIDRETRERNVQAERNPCIEEECNHVASIKRQPSNCVRRPTIPPPLPPVAKDQVRAHEGSKSLEILRYSSSDVPSKEKAMSLDSAQNIQLQSGSRENLTRNDSTNRSSNSSSQGSCSPSSSQSSHETANGSVFLMKPKSRESVTSSLSSHSGNSYIHEDEVASIPKPTSLSLQVPEDERNYLELRKEQNETLRSPFEEEPLYQFYTKGVKERATKLQTLVILDEDQDESLCRNEDLKQIVSNLSPVSTCSSSSGIPSAMQLLHHDIGNQRTLWCEVPEVRASGILNQITVQERKLQEAMFEVITSEASYLKSLTVLIEHFMKCPEFCDDFSVNCVLGRRERHVLFSDVIPVQEVSARLLNDLEHRWQENILISNICDILYEHACKFFNVYVKYCANQVYQDRILKEMKATRPDFIGVLQRLESNPVCQGLDMLSFLMLPMQRITRMPLLVDAIFHRLTTDSPFYDICKLTLVTLNKVVAECNEAARKMERMEEMLVISRQLDFKDCKSIPLISASRWLVKKGELVRLICENTGRNKTFGRSTRYTKTPLYLFLFTDLLLLAKKKNEDAFVVLDYCPRNLVQVFTLEAAGVTMSGKIPETHKNIFQLTMLQNHEFKTIEMILGCPLESDRTRWMEAVTPPVSENPEEKIYEEWDCPQVQCIYPYKAKQPDELTLEESDVVNVFRKMPDGWHEGERLRDGIKGWFPASFTVEIISSHIRARNLRQRYRLLMLSQAYVEEQRKAFLLDKSDRSK